MWGPKCAQNVEPKCAQNVGPKCGTVMCSKCGTKCGSKNGKLTSNIYFTMQKKYNLPKIL
jgi:hypothetical protein